MFNWDEVFGAPKVNNNYNEFIQNYTSPPADTQQEGRGVVDRLLDGMSAGNYAVAGALYNATDSNPNTGIVEGFTKGLAAGNPLGAGSPQDERIFSDVLGNVGWNPQSLPGKVAKGAVGLGLDIALDPLTYVNPFSAASKVVKGTGSVVKGIDYVKPIDFEQAKKYVSKTYEARGKITPDNIDAEAENLMKSFNEKVLKVKTGGQDFEAGLSNLPFADKMFSDKTLEKFTKTIAKSDKLREFGDKTIAPYYNAVTNKLRDTSIIKKFSKYSDLREMAKTDPERATMMFKLDRMHHWMTPGAMADDISAMNKANAVNKMWSEFDESDRKAFVDWYEAVDGGYKDWVAGKRTIAKKVDNAKGTTVASEKVEQEIKNVEDIAKEMIPVIKEEQAAAEVVKKQRRKAVKDTISGKYNYNLDNLSKLYNEPLESANADMFDTMIDEGYYNDTVKKLVIKHELLKPEHAELLDTADNVKSSTKYQSDSFDDVSLENMMWQEQGARPTMYDLLDDPEIIKEYHDLFKTGGTYKNDFVKAYMDESGMKYSDLTNPDNKITYNKSKFSNKESMASFINKQVFEGAPMLDPNMSDEIMQELEDAIKNTDGLKFKNIIEEVYLAQTMKGKEGRKFWQEARLRANSQYLDAIRKNKNGVRKYEFDGEKYSYIPNIFKEHVNRGGVLPKSMAKHPTNKPYYTLNGEKIYVNLSDVPKLANDYIFYQANRKELPRMIKSLTDQKEFYEYVFKGHDYDETAKAAMQSDYRNIVNELERLKSFNSKEQDRIYKNIIANHMGYFGLTLEELGKVDPKFLDDFEDMVHQQGMSMYNRVHGTLKGFDYSGFDRIDYDTNGKIFNELEELRRNDPGKTMKVRVGEKEVFTTEEALPTEFKLEAVDVNTYSGAGKKELKAKAVPNQPKTSSKYERVDKDVPLYKEDNKFDFNGEGKALNTDTFRLTINDMKENDPDGFDSLFGFGGLLHNKLKFDDKKNDVIYFMQQKYGMIEEGVVSSATEKYKNLVRGENESPIEFAKRVKDALGKKGVILDWSRERFKQLPDETKIQLYREYKDMQVNTFLKNFNKLKKGDQLATFRMMCGDTAYNNYLEKRRSLLTSDLAAKNEKIAKAKKRFEDLTLAEQKKILKDRNVGILGFKEKNIEVVDDRTPAERFFEAYFDRTYPAGFDYKNVKANIVAEDVAKTMEAEKAPEVIKPETADEVIEAVAKESPETAETVKEMAEVLGVGSENIPTPSEKFLKLAEVISQHMDELAYKEWKADRLSEKARRANKDRYLAHLQTDEAKAWVIKMLGKEFNGKFNPATAAVGYEKQFNNMREFDTIAEANEAMRKATNGEVQKWFEDDVVKILQARSLLHNRLLYNDEMVNAVKKIAGRDYEKGGKVLEGYTPVISYVDLNDRLLKRFDGTVPDEVLDYIGDGEDFKHFFSPNNAYIEIDDGMLERIARTLGPQISTGVEPIKAFQLDTALMNRLNRESLAQKKMHQSNLLNLYDKYFMLYKMWNSAIMPGFHAQNSVSNLFQSFMSDGRAILDPKLHKTAWDIYQGKNPDQLHKLGDLELTTSQIRIIAEKYGILSNTFFSEDIRFGVGGPGVFNKMGVNPKLDPTDINNFVPYKEGAKAGAHIEGTQRLVLFMNRIKEGDSIEEAVDRVDKFLFDYADLTDFEKDVMKRVMPFYTFMRKNVPLQLEQMLENPVLYMNTSKTINNINAMNGENEVEEEDRTQWNKDAIQIGDIGINPQLPYQQLDKLTPNRIMGQTSPIIKAPIEGITGEYMYTGYPIKSPLDYLTSQTTPTKILSQQAPKEGRDKYLYLLGQLSGFPISDLSNGQGPTPIPDNYFR